jgi:hypothetical protein
MNKDRYFEVAKSIWLSDVPKSGQSLTVQGEMLRCIEKLRDEAQRNGNANRDAGHEVMLAYLAEILLNYSSFTQAQIDEIRRILQDLQQEAEIILDDTPYDYLTDRVVDWYEQVGSKVRVVNPILKR